MPIEELWQNAGDETHSALAGGEQLNHAVVFGIADTLISYHLLKDIETVADQGWVGSCCTGFSQGRYTHFEEGYHQTTLNQPHFTPESLVALPQPSYTMLLGGGIILLMGVGLRKSNKIS